MAGAYCKFCQRRCFVSIPDGAPPKLVAAYGTVTHVATCPSGQAFEKLEVGTCYGEIRQAILMIGLPKLTRVQVELLTVLKPNRSEPIATGINRVDIISGRVWCPARTLEACLKHDLVAFADAHHETLGLTERGIAARNFYHGLKA